MGQNKRLLSGIPLSLKLNEWMYVLNGCGMITVLKFMCLGKRTSSSLTSLKAIYTIRLEICGHFV